MSRSLAHDLWLAGLGYQRSLRRALKPTGLTPTQFHVLHACAKLTKNGEAHPNEKQVTEFVGLEKVTVHRVIDKLTDRDLLERDIQYGRYLSWGLIVSGRGFALLADARPIVHDATKRYLAGCDRDALRKGLSGITSDR